MKNLKICSLPVNTQRPVTALTIIFCLGIITAGLIKFNFWFVFWLIVIFLLASFLSLKKIRQAGLFLSCAFYLLGVILLINSEKSPNCNIRNYLFDASDEPYLVRGMVTSQPLKSDKETSFIFRSSQVQQNNLRRSCCGDILVKAQGQEDLSYSDELILQGSIYRPFTKTPFKRSDQALVMRVSTAGEIIKLKQPVKLSLIKFSLWLKANLEKIIYKHLSGAAAGILDAMVLGDKTNVAQPVFNSMAKTGTIHILVVSGFNVGITAFIIVLFLKLFRITKKARLLIAAILLLIYCFITGASPPVVRATIMAAVFLFSYFFRRQPDIYNSLSLAALFILILKPAEIFNISFQLSFVSVIAIVYLYPRLKLFFKIELLKNKILRFIAEGVLVSLSAWLGTAGFIAYYFRIISPVTVLANLFIVPLASLITLCGFSLIILGVIFPQIALFFAAACEFLILIMLSINNLCLKLPGAYFFWG